MKFINDVLTDELISQAELARASGISENTVNSMCKKKLKQTKRKLRPLTKAKIVAAINNIKSKNYLVEQIDFGD